MVLQITGNCPVLRRPLLRSAQIMEPVTLADTLDSAPHRIPALRRGQGGAEKKDELKKGQIRCKVGSIWVQFVSSRQ
jgi:hypothetical protein